MIYYLRLANGMIKIGCTNDLKARLKALRNYYEGDVTLLKAVPGDKLDEEQIHARFSHLRIRRLEQFKPGEDLLQFIGLDSEERVSPIKPNPLKRDYHAVPIVMPVSYWTALKQHGLASGRSASSIVRDAIDAHLRRERRKPSPQSNPSP